VDGQDPRLLLAQRLRTLRERGWPGHKITQPQLAQALGGVSVPLISSWESQTNPRIPPQPRLEAYAALFATSRSFAKKSAQLISPTEMSDEERRTMSELTEELTGLRKAAMRAGAASPEPGPVGESVSSLSRGPWYFEGTHRIVIVCAQWPKDMMATIPYTQVDDPDYIEMLTYSELDALFEVAGHLRAANPGSTVNRVVADKLRSDDYTSHLVSLGGVDWNTATSSALRMLDLPVRQVADWNTEDGQYFEVEENGKKSQFRPVLEKRGDRRILHEDVALFACSVSPYNQKRILTICNGMYGRGTLGAVRALTDEKFRGRNAEYLRSRFGDHDCYCILTRVPVINGQTLTPDWTSGDFTLYEWSR
jgi:hypothetical protein